MNWDILLKWSAISFFGIFGALLVPFLICSIIEFPTLCRLSKRRRQLAFLIARWERCPQELRGQSEALRLAVMEKIPPDTLDVLQRLLRQAHSERYDRDPELRSDETDPVRVE